MYYLLMSEAFFPYSTLYHYDSSMLYVAVVH